MQNALDLNDQDFEYFRQQVLALSGIHLAPNKRDFVRSRLLARLDLLGLKQLQDYRAYLSSLPPDHGEWQEFINQITTNKTEFFREPTHYRILVEKFLPQWKGQRLRVWSAACARGEEAYTLAMILFRYFRDTARFEIVASDIDTTVLSHAVNGVYPMNRLAEIPIEYQYPSLVKGTGEVKDWFKIRNELKKTITFKRFNLVRDPYDTRELFDVIFCRNVFLYFQPETIDQVCENFSKVLQPDGILVLGHSETLGPQNTHWKSSGPSIYSRFKPKDKEKAAAQDVEKKAKTPSKRSATRKKVLIVDDSATMRQLLGQCLGKSEHLTVVGSVGDPRDLAATLRDVKPDVITLDLKMPHMSGCEVLERVLVDYSIPTLIISAVTMEEGPEVLRALELGAVDYIEKPTFESLKNGDTQLVDRVVQAAATKVRRGSQATVAISRPSTPRKPVISSYHKSLIFIGASTGGIQAITEVLTQLPESIPPILIVQHIPAVFSKAFATRLDTICPFRVKEAEHGDQVLPNQVLIAPGNRHMVVENNGVQGLKVSLLDTAPVNRHRPSVDVLFESAVTAGLGPQIVGVILTGMGNDGAAGLKSLKQHGAQTIAQDEASSAVFGMPREAIRLNAADLVCSLEKIPRNIERLLATKPLKSA